MDSIGDRVTMGGTEASLYYNFPPGTRIGPHRLERQIGVGGMGEVYEVACDGQPGRHALKVLARCLADSETSVEAFRREARLMRELRHPNVVTVEDAGQDGPHYWLRMELMRSVEYEGVEVRSLDDYLRAKQGPVFQGTVFAILEDVAAAAVAAAHARKLVHRDIKPANVLMTHCGDRDSESMAVMDVRVADFGMVKVVGEEWVRRQSELSMSRQHRSLGDVSTQPAERDRDRALIGTYAFMSPEQKRGKPTDERTDVFSLGLTAFRAVTGTDPCPLKPSQIRRDLLPAWDRLLSRALEPDPRRRFANGQEFLEGLEALGVELQRRGLIEADIG